MYCNDKNQSGGREIREIWSILSQVIALMSSGRLLLWTKFLQRGRFCFPRLHLGPSPAEPNKVTLDPVKTVITQLNLHRVRRTRSRTIPCATAVTQAWCDSNTLHM